ncbi:hypothetical protein FQA39_LY03977 [Lamprigera yunnana]|nr:hypothetical protein FQA39_LY03977 [Lamprigera yunnana]
MALTEDRRNINIILDNNRIEQVKEFQYLGNQDREIEESNKVEELENKKKEKERVKRRIDSTSGSKMKQQKSKKNYKKFLKYNFKVIPA